MRFFGTGRSAFSLSSPDISSLLRFLARVVFVGCAYVGVGLALAAGFARLMSGEEVAGAEELVGIEFVGAARVLREAGAGAGADVFLAAAVLVVGAGAVATGCAGADALRRSSSVVWRVTVGMRLTRRSRRDCMLAHCASHCARSFSFRESSSISRLASMLAFASAVMPPLMLFIACCLMCNASTAVMLL